MVSEGDVQHGQPDDVSCVARGQDGDAAWARHRWPQDKETARRARHHLHATLRRALVDDRSETDAELVLAELVANAIQHGTADADGMIEVFWRVDADRIQVSVRDSGHVDHLEAGDQVAAFEQDAVTGRGLALVAALSERWCWNTEHGTYVGAELRRA